MLYTHKIHMVCYPKISVLAYKLCGTIFRSRPGRTQHFQSNCYLGIFKFANPLDRVAKFHLQLHILTMEILI